jgi:hypothetical protein
MTNPDVNGAMSGAELRSIRELLGLSPVWLARHLKMSEREYVLMERGRSPIYRNVASKVEKLAEEASDLVGQLVEKFERDGGGPLITYETDADYEFIQQEQKLPLEKHKPVRWHHHICARVADEIDVRVDYIAQTALMSKTS